jgi:heme exporter protein A
MPMTAHPLFEANRLACMRQNRHLFSELSFKLYPHDCLLIEGANGSGKTTLLRTLTGLSTPQTGEIFWENQPIAMNRESYHANLHFIGHQNGIKLGLTVVENIQLHNHYQLNSLKKTLDPVLEILSLHDFKNTLAGQLSAGQKRRMALVKLWLHHKPLWILDEPYTALDAQTQALFTAHLSAHLKTGGVVIMTSHQFFQLEHAQKSTIRLSAC